MADSLATDVGSVHLSTSGCANAVRDGKIDGRRACLVSDVQRWSRTGGHLLHDRLRYNVFGPTRRRRRRSLTARTSAQSGPSTLSTARCHQERRHRGVLSLTDDVDTPQLTQEELNALVDEAHALRRQDAAHAHGATEQAGHPRRDRFPSSTVRFSTMRRST